MTVERRAGAPRLIDWTGERCVPWTENIQVAYEHYHRYLWAASLTKGRRVLDLGSGEGFGSAILAADAELVLGVDLDERTVAHSELNYSAPNLSYRVGSAVALDGLGDDAFDVVVAFEVLEHLVDQARMLDEIERVLTPDGLLIISTPDRRMYSEATGQDNPFHQHELTESEFRALLGRRFSHVNLWGQRTMCGSRLGALDPGASNQPSTMFVERSGDDWRRAGEPVPMYLVAVASRIPVDLPAAESTLLDHGIQLVRQHEREAVLAREDLRALTTDLERSNAAFESSRQQITSAADANQRLRADISALAAQLAAASRDGVSRDAELADARSQLLGVQESVGWSAFQFLRWQIYQVIGEHSIAGRSIQWGMQRASTVRARRRAARVQPAEIDGPVSPLIRFPQFSDPVASILIPVHARADLTEACLRAIAAHTEEPSYEVIIVDDEADADNRALWTMVEGARVLINNQNLGYLRSVNRAADEARGRFVVPLNNDTRVHPGWLSALVERAESDPGIGIVAPMLLFPDGTLQEAGGIIFQDGSGWNFGRAKQADAPEYNYVRDIDYGSGACLLVRKELWRDLGGYDELYLPMYYEDADLCFAARAGGYRVVYEPTARVVHIEGATAGTDVSSGGKRHQELNRPKFVKKWREQLATQHLPAAAENVRRASDRRRECEVLVVDHRVPFPDRDAGSLRMYHMLASFVDLGCRVTFIPDNMVGAEPYTHDLQQLGVKVLYGAVDVSAEITAIGSDLRLAVLSRPVIAPRYLDVIREHASGATIAYDTVDLHFVREARRAALGNGRARKAASLRELELGLVRGSDVTLVVTDEEREIVLTHVPDARVVVVPVANTVADHVPSVKERIGVLFVGGFEHPPNTDAAISLVRSVMPPVWRQLGPVPVKIVGSNPPEAIRELAGPSVEITGWVKDLTPLYEGARVMVAPLLYGAGMKGKVTQSLAAGLPVVTTPIGGEGLGVVNGQDIMIAEEPAELAEHIICVIRDDELWRSLSRAGQVIAAKVCSPEVMRKRLEELIGDAEPVVTL